MAINRRDFVKAASAASVPLLVNNSPLKAAQQLSGEKLSEKLVPLPLEYNALNKIAYGATESDLAELSKKGLEKYLKEQLKPDDSKDNPIIAQKLAEYTFKVKYKKTKEQKEEEREIPITFLDMSAEEIWDLYEKELKGNNGTISRHPSKEVVLATWLKAVYSKWQLREVMAEFWHNHFNIDGFSDRRIPLFFVQFDRDVIRKHCFGNFRTFLEATAKSPAMSYYLNNNASKASPANENYARELFELHTLGEDNYFNELYDRWKDVPGAEEGKAVGYIDEDVYEAARAFTGWTVGDGSNTGRKREKVPSTGKFHYQDSWHDHYQKRIMGIELSSNQGPMEDAMKVLDIVAYHKGTAEFICKKMCIRLVNDTPSKSLLAQAVATWMKHQKDDDQIAEVIKTIVLSDEFKKSQGQKVKRPFELVASYVRTTGMDFTPNQKLHAMLTDMGYQHFKWPAPTGHPDHSEYWTGTGMMLKRWKAINLLTSPYYPKATSFDALDESIKVNGSTASNFVEYWYKKMIGVLPEEKAKNGLMKVLGKSPEQALTMKDKYNAKQVVVSIGMLTEFQVR